MDHLGSIPKQRDVGSHNKQKPGCSRQAISGIPFLERVFPMATAVKASGGVITSTLLDLDLKTVRVKVEGSSPLIVHKFSEKSKRQMLAKMQGKASKGKEPRDPSADYEGAFHRLPDGRPGFPLLGFKACAVTACTSLNKEISKVLARQAFHIQPHPVGGDLYPVEFPEDCPPVMREDTVKVGMGATDLRYRPEFKRWGAELVIQFNARAISHEQLVNLMNLGGFAVGVGEHRPERDGDKGRFQVVNKFSWE